MNINKTLAGLAFKCLTKIYSDNGCWITCTFFYQYMKVRKEIRKSIEPYVAKYAVTSPGIAQEKYLDIDFWALESLYRYYCLGLHDGGKIRILDIGTGAGYFPFVCKYFGHKVEAIDVPDNHMYNDIAGALRIHRHLMRIKSFRSIELEGEFDLVTAFMVCFNNHKQQDLWCTKEWQFFLNDLNVHNLREGALVYLALNKETETEPVSTKLLEYFRLSGAIVESNVVQVRQDTYKFGG